MRLCRRYARSITCALFGAFASVIAYYAAFYAAKWFPSYRRDLFRRQRIALQQKHRGDDSTGFRPSSSSAAGSSSSSSSSSRAQSEYERSSYWDSHRFQQRWRRASDRTSSSSSAAGGAQRGAGGGDPKGYYKTLGLRGDESVNELRSAYRRLVLSQHPDVGGSTAQMTKINEAYRVLRDPKRRAEYDRQ